MHCFDLILFFSLHRPRLFFLSPPACRFVIERRGNVLEHRLSLYFFSLKDFLIFATAHVNKCRHKYFVF